MSHQTEVVGYKKLSNGQVSVCIRCCGQESTDSWHSMLVAVAGDPAKRQASIDEARTRVAEEHELAQKSEQAAIELMGEKKDHP